MASDLKGFVKDAKALVGKEVDDVPAGTDLADWLTIRRFCAALGDPNLLYKDPGGGVATRYNSMIAPPTFVAAIRTPNSGGPYVTKQYGVSPFLTRGSFEWTDIIRVGDRLESTIKVTDVKEAGKRWGYESADVESTVEYRNSYGGLIGTGKGVNSMVAYERGKDMIESRDIYRYSDEEIHKIENDIESEPEPRGKLLRYYDDVEVGEDLPQLVKGPMTLSDMMAWVVAEAKSLSLGALVYNDLKEKYPGRVVTNPTTNWPYWDADQSFEDILSCEEMGFKSPPSRGIQRVCLAGQVVTHWMGDDAFLRSLDICVPEHWVYGDTMWLNGKVTAKRTEEVGSESYFAVDIAITGVNQLGTTIAEGTATAYLPNPGHPVALPVPH
tara:strand:+ start:1177 stop:2325 length:1149 start_codon:yes stop_codon:yes gene_type:complete